VRAGGVALTAEGRRAVIRGYERRLEVPRSVADLYCGPHGWFDVALRKALAGD
jgi:hypothetical protein